MNTMQYPASPQEIEPRAGLSALIPIALGLCALYIPTFVSFAQTLWQTEDEGHGPLILIAALWMFYESAKDIKDRGKPAPMMGCALLAFGLLAYIIGRSQGIAILEVASMIPTISGALVATFGWATVNTLRFPLFFLIFMAPLPGFIVDAMTGPLKLFISSQAEALMYAAGYPVARMGVALSIGQYQLLVADACSGLNSMVSLIAVGLFFMHLVKRKSLLHRAILLTLIPMIAIAANLVRVVAICLVTYYFGDEVGQGFVHGATGILLFGVSLTLMFVADWLLAMVIQPDRARA